MRVESERNLQKTFNESSKNAKKLYRLNQIQYVQSGAKDAKHVFGDSVRLLIMLNGSKIV